MNNNQDLIKWMTETRENLTFDSKAQLLKEFWDKRNRIKDLEQKEKKLEEKEQNYSTRVSNLENHANLLLNQELSPTELVEELNRLKSLFTNAKLPNTYEILEEVCQQLLTISQMFNADGLSSGSRPSSRSSSRPPSPIRGEDKKREGLEQEKNFESQKAQNYLEQITELTAELYNKDEEIEELKATIRQLKQKNKQKEESPPPPKTSAETLITQILTVLDGWKDNSVGEQKNRVQQVIKQLADNKGSQKEQYQAVQDLLDNCPNFKNKKLEDYLKQWEKLLTE